MSELKQHSMEARDQAARQGIIVLNVTGKLPCQIMLERSEMLGYLSKMAESNEGIAAFIKQFHEQV